MSLWLFFTRAILDWNVSGTNCLDAFGILQCNTEAAFLEKISRTVYCLHQRTKSSHQEPLWGKKSLITMDVYELLPSIVMTVLFLGILPFGQKVWISADLTITSAWGLMCITFPQFVMQYQVSTKIIFDRHRIYDILGY